MLKIELHPAPNGTPGQGELRVKGWKHTPVGLELAIQRNQDSYYLDANGHWSASQRWTALGEVQDTDGALQTLVGPWLVDPLTADQRMAYMLSLRNSEGSDNGVLRMVGELLSSAAAGSSPAAPATSVAPAVVPAVAPPAPTPEPAPESEAKAEIAAQSESPVEEAPRPPPKKPRRWPLLALMGVLAAAGLAAWWWLSPGSKSPPDAEPTIEAEALAPDGPCHPQILTTNNDDLALLQACVKSNPSSAQTLQLISAAESAKRCNLAQRLFAYKAQSGDVEVALAYARRYDPEGFTAGACIDKADGETAAYWYERVLDQQPDNAQAKQRLEALQP